MSIIGDNRNLTTKVEALCDKLEDLTRELDDGTIKASIQLLRGHIKELREYDILWEKGILCESIPVLELFQQAFDSTMRQLPKDKKLTFVIRDEGERVLWEDKDSLYNKYTFRHCYSSLGIIPQLLMDNAVKYAPSETEITIDIHQDVYRKTIVLSNVGPRLEDGEEQTIFSLDENYRGQNAQKSDVPGQGMGLKLANLIISGHSWRDATISVSTQEIADGLIINGIPYGLFSLELSVKEPTECDEVLNEMDNRQYIEEFLSHEYSRTNPLLGKHVREIYEESFSRKECYRTIDVENMRQVAYDLYKLVMTHLYKNIIEVGDESESDTMLPSSSKRFDNQLITSIKRAVSFKKSKLTIQKERGSFGFAPMYYSMHMFYFLMSEYIASFPEGELSLYYVGRNRYEGDSMELIAPEGEDFYGISKESWAVICGIMEKHGVIISRKGEKLIIIRNK